MAITTLCRSYLFDENKKACTELKRFSAGFIAIRTGSVAVPVYHLCVELNFVSLFYNLFLQKVCQVYKKLFLLQKQPLTLLSFF